MLLVEAVCREIENIVAGSLRKSWDKYEFVEQKTEQPCTQEEHTYLAHGQTVGFGTILLALRSCHFIARGSRGLRPIHEDL